MDSLAPVEQDDSDPGEELDCNFMVALKSDHQVNHSQITELGKLDEMFVIIHCYVFG